MMDINRKDMMIAVGITIGAAVLVLFMKRNSSQAAAGSGTGGVTDIMGGFTSASTVFVPTSSYDLNYNTYKGSVTYSTITNNSQSETTTTYAPVNSNNNNPINSPTGGSTVSGSNVTSIVSVPAPAATSGTPIITTGSSNVVNIPTQQTNTQPAAPPAVAASPPPAPRPAPAPSVPTWENALQGMHYATPRGGWDPNSVVDNLKSHGYNASLASRQQLASSMGISGYQGTAAQNVQMLNTLKAVGL